MSLTFFFLFFFSFRIGIDETIELIRANGGTCVGYKVDISKKEEVYKAADDIRRDVGDVSIQTIYTNSLLILFVIIMWSEIYVIRKSGTIRFSLIIRETKKKKPKTHIFR